MSQLRHLNIRKWALEKAAQAWCQPDTCTTVMDPTLCMAFAEILDREALRPCLGLASTKELIDELSARVDLNYRTVEP